MVKEDRPGSFPISLRFSKKEDPLYDEILGAPDPRQYIKSRLLGANPPIKRNDPIERIADSLEAILDLLKNHNLQLVPAAEQHSPKEEKVEPAGTDLSRKFSSVLNDSLKTKDWI